MLFAGDFTTGTAASAGRCSAEGSSSSRVKPAAGLRVLVSECKKLGLGGTGAAAGMAAFAFLGRAWRGDVEVCSAIKKIKKKNHFDGRGAKKQNKQNRCFSRGQIFLRDGDASTRFRRIPFAAICRDMPLLGLMHSLKRIFCRSKSNFYGCLAPDSSAS